MRLIAYLLLLITISLMFGTYIGNETLKINVNRLERAYILGCGVGVQTKKQYDSPLTYKEILTCIKAGALFKDVLNSKP